jgi:pyruvate, water dikinase
MKEISGIAVSLGKATGRVRIVESAQETAKVEAGDILVAVMTRPDYVLAMRKAAAIVTDEGGLTCHAAIVARELKIPCIVGTRNTTKILKDNDLVEVDADNNIVRLLDKGHATRKFYK